MVIKHRFFLGLHWHLNIYYYFIIVIVVLVFLLLLLFLLGYYKRNVSIYLKQLLETTVNINQ